VRQPKLLAGAVLLSACFLNSANAEPLLATSLTVINSNADGFISAPSSLFPGDLTSFDLTGGNNGSGSGGETDAVITALTAGIVSFQWSYTSCDPAPACDFPGYDWTGYMDQQNQVQLTDTDTGGVTSPASFAVSSGDTFGWYVGTFDNNGGPGILTVSDVTFTSSDPASPEPGTLLTGFAALAVSVVARSKGYKK
jgi:hypothetical protein